MPITYKTIGFIGLGRMGLAMASNLQRKGFAVLGYDLNARAVETLAALGASKAASIAEVAKGADIIFTMLPASPEVRSVVIDGILPQAAKGALFVDMSTIDPMTTDEIAGALQAAGMAFVDAPVGRLASHADRGESLFMVGAAPDDFERVKPLLAAMGTTIHHCGPAGAGIRMKIVNNYLAIAACQLNAETLTLATRFGLDTALTIDVLNGTTANNGHLKTNFPAKVLIGDIEPGFQIDLAHKDLSLAMASASAMRVPLSMGAAARECLQLARSRGYGAKDFSGLLDAWCDLAGVAPPRLPQQK
jgi:4-hydroxybutyrate dehydrogenase/sulfolactaldehyde 3-reductase